MLLSVSLTTVITPLDAQVTGETMALIVHLHRGVNGSVWGHFDPRLVELFSYDTHENYSRWQVYDRPKNA